jgi:hypothetical protein
MKKYLMRWSIILVILLALFLVVFLLWTGYQGRFVQRGMNLVAWQTGQYPLSLLESDLQQMRVLGVQWVAIVVTWYQASTQSTEIIPDPQKSPDDETLVQLLRRLRELGFRAFLRPMVDVQDGRWRGEITFASEDQWETWFQSYERFLWHYAKLAAQENAALFSVGVELEQTVLREHQWRELIARVRKVYHGTLTYSANWDGFELVPFWDALDYVGIDSYFDLDLSPGPTLDDLMTAWQPWVRHLEKFAARVQKPILFTEIGVRSVQGASRHPWDWHYEAPISLQEQANYYEAVFQVFWEQPWLAGFYFWAWVPGLGGPEDASYTPAGKPAASILKRWYTKQR